MKKTKLMVDIHARGDMNDSIVRMVTNHNEGKVIVTLGLISTYCHAKWAEYPTITPVMRIDENVGKRELSISEIRTAGIVPTITIKEITIDVSEETPINTEVKL
jgi:hypothetical protein